MIEDDVINRVRSLTGEKQWTAYRLAKKSGLSDSTVNNIFGRGTCPGVPTLKKICNGFGISLSQFFEFEENPLGDTEDASLKGIEGLAEEEDEILKGYRSLSKTDKKLVRIYIKRLCK